MKIPAFLAGTLTMALTLSLTLSMSQAADTLRQQHEIPAITRVVIETPGDVGVRPGAPPSLTIEAEQKVLDALDFVVDGDTLFLRSKRGFSTQHGLGYVIVVPKLQALTSRSSGSSKVGAFSGKRLDIEIAGSGDATLEGVVAQDLRLHVSGSGNIEASGSGKSLQAEISGSGGILAGRYAVTRAEANISGSGEIVVNASKTLSAVISGSGNIRHTGKPVITRSISGAGSVDPL